MSAMPPASFDNILAGFDVELDILLVQPWKFQTIPIDRIDVSVRGLDPWIRSHLSSTSAIKWLYIEHPRFQAT